MSYSITPILHPYKDSNGLRKIQIRIIYNRCRVYLKTDFKSASEKFNDKVTALLRKQVVDAESLILDAMRDGLSIPKFKELFKHQRKASVYLIDYFDGLIKKLKGKYSPAFLKHYSSSLKKITDTYPLATFADVDRNFLESVEQSMRGKVDPNTINSNMKRIKSMFYKAAADGLITEDSFRRYKVPVYKQKLVEYLTEKEITAFSKLVKTINQPAYQVAGYYFLLSCYTGWRISDVKRFDYSKMVQGGKLVLRAKKNGQIVSIPIHSRLKDTLKFIQKNPFSISEQKVRNHIKELARLSGITKSVKFHTGRHSFAMLLMANGFTIDEVSELIGDSVLITKVYAKVHNESLDRKIRERLG